MRLFWILLIVTFLLLGSVMIISSEDLDLNNDSDVKIFLKESGIWLKQVFTNMVELTGEAIKKPWLPESDEEKNNQDK